MLIFWASRILKNIEKFLGFKDSEKDSESIFWASRVLKRILNSIFGRQRSWNGFRMHILSLESHKNDSEYKFWVSRILKKIQNAILGLFDPREPWKGFWIAFSELEEFSLNTISHAKFKKTVSDISLPFLLNKLAQFFRHSSLIEYFIQFMYCCLSYLSSLGILYTYLKNAR